MAFGKSIGFVENGNDVGGLIQAFYDMAPMAGLVAALPNIVNPLLENSVTGRWLMPTSGDGTGIGKVMKYRDNMLEKRLETRHALQHGDFLDNIMNAKNADGSYMTVEEVKVEALVLMVAATDTSAAFISPFVHNVIQNSHIYARLREEITLFEQQGKLPTGIVTYEQTLELPYFMACVKETLRFSPSTPIIMPRLVSSGGMEIEGHWVPAGTEIGANPYVVHRSTDIFGEDAHEFHPERWLVSEEHSKEMDKHMMAWGYGARVCLGKNIAQLTTQKLCLELFRRFDLGTQDVDNPWRAENWGIMVYWDQWLSIKAAALAST
ncbi:hypothetical protein FH972_023961 [Carpinus fangiana]|uniref:Cytochrome P450 n=1 Tax=Carpinus fangiana TaxID=176857 RepID=A0A5N6KX60_9ROSI|nr:hypothetical protein FH972_023961 [Carpinus fangiana]